MAYGKAQQAVRETQNLPVPLHLRNPVTSLMKEVGYGQGYQCSPYVDVTYLPDNLRGKKFYLPSEQGFEKEIRQRMEYLLKLKREKRRGINT
jgi:putative ATPase